MSEAKRTRVETSRDPNIWLQWLNELSDEEKDYDDASEDEEQHENQDEASEHNSETPQELSETEEDLSNEYEEGVHQNNNYFVAVDKKNNREIKWSKQVPNPTRTRSHNIIIHLPGTKGDARNAKSETDCLKLFISDSVVSLITESTNIFIQEQLHKYGRDRDCRKVDEREIRAYIGILLVIGSLRSSRQNVQQIFDNSKGSGIELCYLAMSEKRFRFICRCLRFDDCRNRSERKKIDKLAPIRQLLDVFLDSFRTKFTPSEYLTIDEQLLAFRGRCSFKQYIPSKPAKYGLKVFALVDCKTAYTLKLEPYVGIQPEGPYRQSNSAEDVVLRMVESIKGSNRNITCDNWFSSFPLIKKLLEEKNLTFVGTLRKNKVGIPPEFLPNRHREPKTSLFGFQRDLTLLSYVPKKGKSVLVVSSMHHDNEIDTATGDNRKPSMITFYNRTKIGVDLLDQLCQKYDVARNTRRWPIVLFHNLLNISAINALCIYKFNNREKEMARRKFIENCAWTLIVPQIEHRATIQNVSAKIRRRARELLGLQELSGQNVQQTNVVRRCSVCPRNKDKSTRKTCTKCGRFVCSEHSTTICTTCIE